MSDIQRGAVAMIDALGFRGIWGPRPEKPSLEAFVTLKAVRTSIKNAVREFRQAIAPKGFPADYRALVKDPNIQFRFLSDTIIIAASVRPRQRAPRRKRVEELEKSGFNIVEMQNAVDALMRYIVCHCVCVAVQAAGTAATPLAYRGAVAVGFFALEDNFVLGPAVDEAASLMNLADAAMVVLAPSASKLSETLTFGKRGVPWDDMTISSEVPMRDGRTLRARVINPFCLGDEEHARKMRRHLVSSMTSPHIDVSIKRQNTQRFFRAIEQRAKDRATLKRIQTRKLAREVAASKATESS